MFLFSLQSLVPPDPPGTSKEEMEKLKEELKMWKASSAEPMESWKFAKRQSSVHPSKIRSTPPHIFLIFNLFCSLMFCVDPTLGSLIFTQSVKNK